MVPGDGIKHLQEIPSHRLRVPPRSIKSRRIGTLPPVGLCFVFRLTRRLVMGLS